MTTSTLDDRLAVTREGRVTTVRLNDQIGRASFRERV